VSFVIGRADSATGQTGQIGTYRARDGSDGAQLCLDFDSPHAVSIVGKRGYGKSYTLGVLAEELSRSHGVAPIVLDPIGVFSTLTESATGKPVPATVIDTPVVSPDKLGPRSWCSLLGLPPDGGPGSLIWQATQHTSTITEMQARIEATDTREVDRRAATNHLDLADSWDIFGRDGTDVGTLTTGAVTVVDVSGLDIAPMNAVAHALAETLYRARLDGTIEVFPWLLVDEAHVFFEGVAAASLRRLLTRGRAPGVSLVFATQRPSAVPAVGVSQADILISHRLTSQKDLDALRAARPSYLDRSLPDRLPTAPGDVVVVDDTTESVHAARIRERATPHGGNSPRVRDHQ
jgi:hypothetical protein